MSNEDLNSFTLPWSWRPGSDLMCKLLFNNPTVVNLVAQSLLGTDIQANSYCVASNEWADGTRSDIVYAAGKPTKIEPPILIEFQNQVNHEFMMNRVISYSLPAYRRYKVYPIVLIFAIKGFSLSTRCFYCMTD